MPAPAKPFDEMAPAKVGWIAYFVAGIKHLHGRRTRVHVRIDDEAGTTTRLRSLLIGNCGRLPGGITLLPAYVLPLLPHSIVGRKLKGKPPLVDLAMGYREDNPSPVLATLLRGVDQLVEAGRAIASRSAPG